MMVTLGTFLLVALMLLALRQHRLEVTSASVGVRNEIVAREQTIQDQRAEIARQVTPWTLAANLKAAGMDTGEAMTSRTLKGIPGRNGPVTPAVETDLVAPVMGDGVDGGASGGSGHENANRPR